MTQQEQDRLREINAELLEACKLMIELRDSPHGFRDNPWYDEAFKAMRAAIAKATDQ